MAFFLLTSLANVGFLALGGVALATGLLHGSPSVLLGLIPAAVAVAAISLALVAPRCWRERLARRSSAARLAAGERRRRRRRRGAGAAANRRSSDPGGAAGYMLFDVAMLGVCFAAFGNDVPPVGVLLVAYIIGQLGSLIPIPGGIGGVDAGLVGTLVLYGVDATDAAVAVLAYRGLLLSIPALLGLPALAVLRRRLRDEAHDIAACAPGDSVEVLGRGVVQRPEPITRALAKKTPLATPAAARSALRPGTGYVPLASTSENALSRTCASPACRSAPSLWLVAGLGPGTFPGPHRNWPRRTLGRSQGAIASEPTAASNEGSRLVVHRRGPTRCCLGRIRAAADATAREPAGCSFPRCGRLHRT